MYFKNHLLAAFFLSTASLGQDCSPNGGDCRDTRCCQDANSRCFLKDAGWASCNATCSHDAIWNVIGWARAEGEHVWDCTELTQCSDGVNDGENCMDSKCCTNPGSKCFKKNDHWASCNATCNPYALYDNGWIITDTTNWDCTMLMPDNLETTPQPGAEGEACAPPTKDGDDCRESMSCENPGSKCFVKNNGWASCNATCSPKALWVDGSWQEQQETTWDCTELVTACVSSTSKGPSAAVLCSELTATDDGQDCSKDKLCANPGSQCYRKNKWWSTCNASCAENKKWESGAWITVDEQVWDCKVLTTECSEADGTALTDASAIAAPQQPVLYSVQGVMMCALAAMLVSAAGTLAFLRRPTGVRLISDSLAPEE